MAITIISKIFKKFLKINKPNPQNTPKSLYTKFIFGNKKYLIGEYTYGTPNVIFENKNTNLVIGKYCSIAQDVTIFLGGNHRPDWVTTYPFNALPDFPEYAHINGHPASKGDVAIGNDVWVGYKSIILSGVKIADGAVIAASSVVTKDIGPYEIWGGNPAKFIKKRFTEEQIEKLLEIKWWNWNDEKVQQKIPQLLDSNIDLFIRENLDELFQKK